MKKIHYSSFMKNDPTKVGSVINQVGQLIEFYEHPIFGDTHTLIGVCKAEQIAFHTDFFDIDDFGIGSDYNPIVLTTYKVVPYYLFGDLNPAQL